MSCLHTESVQSRNEAIHHIQSKLSKYPKPAHPQLVKLVGMALSEWTNTPHPIIPTFLSNEFRILFFKQSMIGWDQILYGRFAKEWISHSNNNTQWLEYTIRTIWLAYFEVWKTRCDKIHGGTEHSKRNLAILALQPQLESLYQEQSSLPTTESYLFKTTLEAMLQQPVATIMRWIFRTKLRIRQYKINQKQKANLNKIHPFFTTCPKPDAKQNTSKRKEIRKTKIKNNQFMIHPITTFFIQIAKHPTRKSKTPKDDLKPP
jgi:hypothetical protein